MSSVPVALAGYPRAMWLTDPVRSRATAAAWARPEADDPEPIPSGPGVRAGNRSSSWRYGDQKL